MPTAKSSYSDWKHPTASADDQVAGWGVLRQQIVPHNVPVAEAGQGPPSWFYALTFGILNGDGGYVGIQTDSGGQRAIFSIWHAVDATAGPGATASAFSGEGNGYQILLPYAWDASHVYEVEVRFLIESGLLSTDPRTWEGYITNLTTGVRTYIGKIRTPHDWTSSGGEQRLNYHPANFVEWYPWSEDRACTAFPYSSVSFRSPRLEQLPGSSGPGAAFCVEERPDQFAGPCSSSVTPETSGGLASKLHRNGFDVPNPPPAPPVLESASISSDTLTLNYSKVLDATKVPTSLGITISVNGGHDLTNSGVAISGDLVLVSFPAVVASDVVTASYYSTFLATANRIQTPAGDQASGFSALAVANATSGTPSPEPPPLVADPAPPADSIELEVRSLLTGALKTRLRRSKARGWQDTGNDVGTGSLVIGITDLDSLLVAAGDLVICTINGVYTATVTAGSTTLTSTSAVFSDTDLGKEIRMEGVRAGTTILGRIGADETAKRQNVRLSAAAIETITAGRMSIVGRHDAFAWIVEDEDEMTIHPDEEKGQMRTVSGKGRGAVLEHAVLFPEAGGRGDTRTFDYTSSNYFGVVTDDPYTPLPGHGLGTQPNQVVWSVDPRNRFGYANGVDDSNLGTYIDPWGSSGTPSGWPTDGTSLVQAEWLWPFQIGRNPGEGYFRLPFPVRSDETGHYRVFYTADDFVEVFLDGERLASTQEPQMFYRTFTVDFDAVVGDHILSAHVRNTGGPGGFLMEMWQLGTDGTLLQRRRRTNTAEWHVAGDSLGAPAPGMTAGHIVSLLMTEARERGDLTGVDRVPMGFSALRDSYDSYWGQLINPTLQIGQSYLQLMAMLADLGVDWWVEPRTGMLRLSAQPRGLPRSAAFTKGVNIRQLQHRRNRETLVNSLLGRVTVDSFSRTGWVTEEDSTSVGVYGRREAFISASSQPPAQWPRLAAATLSSSGVPAETATLESVVRQDLTGAARVVPYADYSVGDWVSVPGPSASPGAKPFRLRAIAVSEDADGKLHAVPELGSVQAELTERVMRWLTTMVPGTLGGTLASGAIPAEIGRFRLS